MSNPFTADVIAAITKHMNHDHADDTLLICRGVGGRPTATAARMLTFDGDGGDYAVTVDGTEEEIRIPWERPLRERPEVRPEIVRLYRESAAALHARA
ncbi:DUF2470 domain-containing protein [Phytomonospora endophytica]|uniref:Putative heme iron utilization protein n=1 Tax=Phytomonospora endophytica TaxID=714109 RepID=A0A841FJ72_9ACTN|nr:DUF2470 domain-containing protein [Phytomonospora endophytica]MBB6036246.1 putative heme iron utilization protein [Phytomonospora endophytica]GIG67153.1 hypothetical protein Pen01_34480 [Phytomonospora endophytica]